MEEQKKQVDKKLETKPVDEKAKSSDNKKTFGKDNEGPRKNFRKGGGRGPRKRTTEKPKDEFEQKIVDLARVTRVMAGGKRMKFRATMVIGDKKGRVGIGIAKGADVSQAIQKSVAKAKKNLIEVPIVNGTVPHQISIKQNSARLLIRPAKKGNGIKAGGVMRTVLELAGIRDVVAKILGTNNKVNNAKATVKALNSFVPQAVAAAKNSNKLKTNAVAKTSDKKATQVKKQVKNTKESK